MSFFTGTPGRFERLSNLDPSQQGTFQNLNQTAQGAFGQAGDYYRRLLSDDNTDFDAMAAPELRRFKQQIIPDLAEQFAGMGSGGAIGGSGFQNAAATAGADLSERLGALRAQLRQNAAAGITGIGQMGLQNFGENVYRPATPGFLDTVAGGVGQGVGTFLGSKFR